MNKLLRSSLGLALFCLALAASGCSDDGPAVDDPVDVAPVQDVAPDTATADVALPDVPLPDIADAFALDCPGGPGCPCTQHSDCDHPKCIATATGSVCARKCVDDCPDGFKCVTPSGDSASLCLPAWGLLCRPCTTTSECAAAGGAKTFCVGYGDGGAAGGFCGATCGRSADCPAGYICKFVATTDSGQQQQCIRESPKAEFGECSCDEFSRKTSVSTTCWLPWTNTSGAVVGRCKGQRVCGAAGLGACTQLTGAAQVCEDQQCVNQTDGAPCDDADPCTKGDKCKAGACAAGDDLCECQQTADCAGKTTPCKPLYCNTDTAPYTCDVIAAQVVDCSNIPTAQCSVSVCDPTDGKCKPQPTAKNSACDDNDACTVGDTCDGKGTCAAGSDLCGCTADTDCLTEEDGDVCNGTLYCDKTAADKKDWQCKLNPGTVIKCPALDKPCTKSLCAPESGKCATVHLPKTATCNDADSCTGDDRCDGQGGCAGTTAICPCTTHPDCATKDDGDLCNGVLYCDKAAGSCKPNPASVIACPSAMNTACATNTCAAKTGTCSLQPAKDGKLCDDGDPCVQSTSCKTGQCAGGTNTCACDKDADCAGKHGGDLCIGTFYCDLSALGAGQQSVCRVNPVTTVVCPTVDDTACRRSVCAPKSGTCGLKDVNETGLCEADGNPCTPHDRCAKGVCTAGANLCACTQNADCESADDGNACNGTLYCDKSAADATQWSCAVNLATAVTCDTSSDTACRRAVCAPSTGKCGPKAVFVGQPCDDGEPCTAGDTCVVGAKGDGECAAGVAACGCVKNADCSKFDNDLCGPKYACAPASKKCLKDPSTAVKCPASTVCETVACEPKTGNCVTSPHDGKVCAVGDACFGPGKCSAGTCQQAVIKTCDDGNGCTDDSCDGETGCVALANSATCSDGDACSVGDACKASACVAGLSGFGCGCAVGKDCGDGLCVPAANGSVCSKTCVESCPSGYRCAKLDTGGDVVFACLGTPVCADKPAVCDDDNPCTDDACDVTGKGEPKTGCVHLANAVTCSDGDACTGTSGKPDRCVSSTCESGEKTGCDDNNPCTDDTCAKSAGCVSLANQASCTDGDACTLSDVCKGGGCLSGKTRDCGDGNGCTDDACDKAGIDGPAGACLHTNSAQACTDGDACTDKDGCKAGKCASGAALGCDDKNACTTDSCDPAKGCTNVPHSKACDDNDACTTGDACGQGKCVPGKARLWNVTLPVVKGTPGGKLAAIVQTPDGGFAAAGQIGVADGNNGWLVRFDTHGNKLWEANFGGAKPDEFFDLLLLDDGGFMLGGVTYSSGAGGEDMWLVRTDKAGKLVWEATYGGSGNDSAHALIRQGPTRVAAIGNIDTKTANASDAWVVTIEYDAGSNSKPVTKGDVKYGEVGSDVAYAGLAHGEGVIAGRSKTVMWLKKIGAGALGFSKTYGHHKDSQLHAVVGAGTGGGFAVTGWSGDGGWLLHVDAKGELLWERKLDGSEFTSGHDLVELADGSLVVTGSIQQGATSRLLLGRIDGNGTRWQRRLGGESASTVGKALLWLGDGGFAVVGSTRTQNPTLDAGVIIRTDPWGHATCSESGKCAALTTDACADGNRCTLDMCEPKTGCSYTPIVDDVICANGAVRDRVTIPAGPFWMGCNASVDNNCATWEKPQHEVTLSGYAIDRYEVAVDKYELCVKASICPTPVPWGQDTGDYQRNWKAAGRSKHPINGVGHTAAALYCGWVGGRLPTEAEWEKAARGGCDKYPGKDCAKSMPVYPWGNQAAFDCQKHVHKTTKDGCGTGTTLPVGSKAQGASVYGVHDMAGNVAEWVSDRYSETYYGESAKTDPPGPSSGSKIVHKGERFTAPGEDARCSKRTGTAVSYLGGVYHGIRCAWSLSCDDGDACTVDTKNTKTQLCEHQALSCDDANACTSDSCDKADGCRHVANTKPCTDGDACTATDACKDKVCVTSPPKTCDDGNVCTIDACDAQTGACTFVNGPCTQAPCTTSKDCAAGVCDGSSRTCTPCRQSSDCTKEAPLCQANKCVKATECTSSTQCKAEGKVCAKAIGACVECTGNADCSAGTCVEFACRKSTACTSDKVCPNVCDTQAKKCVQCLEQADCGTGKFCGTDKACHTTLCTGNVCLGGRHYACKSDGSGFVATDCDDSEPCTIDACDAAKSTPCSHTKRKDGLACGDTVTGGKCLQAVCRYPLLEVVSGNRHSCARSKDLSVWCWGNNHLGQLGHGVVNQPGMSSEPWRVPGVEAVQLAATNDCTCALAKNGQVSCWGEVPRQFLGLAQGPARAVTAPVVVLSGGKALAVGLRLACVVDATGHVSCRGLNEYNNMPGVGGDAVSQQKLANLDSVKAVALGRYLGLALRTDGAVFSWGIGAVGRTGGQGPSQIPSLGQVKQVAADEDGACALNTAGTVKCWGGNEYGQVGNGKTSPNNKELYPQAVVGLSNVASIDLGEFRVCAVLGSGGVRCWGRGYVGMGLVSVAGLTGAIGVSPGYQHICSVTSAGAIWCWGSNNFGQVGDGTGGWNRPPTKLALADVASLGEMGGGTCALRKDKSVWCWDSNTAGVPAKVTGLPEVLALAPSGGRACGLVAGGGAYCWSATTNAQMVAGLAGASLVRTGQQHACAVVGGAVKCWGANQYGQLGNGKVGYEHKSDTPVAVASLTGIKELALGRNSCALATDGKVWCWGERESTGNGQQGGDYAAPVAVKGIDAAESIAAGLQHTCAVVKGGDVWCWGDNAKGQLGVTGVWHLSPIKVASGASAVFSGSNAATTFVRQLDGTMIGWGDDAYGQIGGAAALGLIKGAPQLMVGSAHTCGLTAAGDLYCWGSNQHGRIGNGGPLRQQPTRVVWPE